MPTPRVLVVSLMLALLAVPGGAAEVYSCVGADGTVSFSDQPCKEGVREERRDVTLPATGWDSSEIRERNQPLLDEYDARQAQQREERQATEEQARERRQTEEEQEAYDDTSGRQVQYLICPNGRYCPPPPWPRPGHRPPPPAPAPRNDDRFPPNPRAPMSIPRDNPSSLH
ncbi:hypothetical protein Thimo_0926 [Thioflavicoccus mobilis 8321]|uniref:DUF4124 domain-containing protein n=1 Tax=Thioflavicoccus mobilis 8321 TaxID=765912 RepID=L0GUS5_9GAMM|nr:DUF4124 domain-containing protein [Thioflavicoccus mobilis]AGA89756.1 hypothetical protein Thimo_0926 [Thioflavicoccus mobilis 8321]